MALEERVNLDDDSPTVQTWHLMLVDVGGLPESTFSAFVTRQREFVLRDRFGWFEHETAGYDAAWELIPPELRAETTSGNLVQLKNEIHLILDRNFHQRPFNINLNNLARVV